MILVDTHCHLDLLDQSDSNNAIDKVIERAYLQEVYHLLNVCVAISEFPLVLKTAEAWQNVYASVGLHPNNQDEEVDLETLLRLGEHQKVIAIGETGLDYFRSTGNLDWQRDRFRIHIEAAKQLQKPLIIHTRDASVDTLKLMQAEGARDAGGVMHCFTETWDVAKSALDLGFYISFSGIVTFKSAENLQEVARKVPLDRLLIETDSPYLAPNPHRGKPNEPSYVRYTAEFIANLRKMSLNDFAEKTTHNFFNLFKGAL